MVDRLYRVFGSRVRARREEMSITQEELGSRVDLSRTSITNIEKGRQRVLLHQMVEIAQALGTAPTELLDPFEPAQRPAPLRDDVAKVVATLRAETRSS
jgi:transcriptional regulator with XRE-family HTH domain